jgi:hypothetical protein
MAPTMDDLGLVEAIDRLGECVVIAVTDVADGGLDAGFSQPFGVANAHILRSAVAMVGQSEQEDRRQRERIRAAWSERTRSLDIPSSTRFRGT